MKFSKALIPTLREAPGDAEVVSHQLLVRSGMIRKVTAGIYEFLPLGIRSLHKVAQIVREEMDKSGGQEIFMPNLIPADLWQESGRWQKYGPELLRIKDRHDREYCFGPTHEEVVCDLVKQTVHSYKALPLNLYQIQTKFRDEIRPRFGLMRGREFMMKDAYSFHTDLEGLDVEYKNMYKTYESIFKRCGLDCRAVDADTGSIGGSSSHEFMVLASTGEDEIASCDVCSYAANIEKAYYAIGKNLESPVTKDREDVSTPNQKSIEDVSSFLKIKSQQMIKTLCYVADDAFVIICVSGDRDVSEVKLKALTSAAEVRMALDEEILEKTNVPTGFLGPIGLKGRIYYDRSLAAIYDGVTGANKADFHTVNINIERDLGLKNDPSFDGFVDLSVVAESDPCPQCAKGKLNLMRGIEVGHIFKLGDVYAKPMKVHYLDKDGKEKAPVMGCYGIGVSRTLAASIEQNHDDKGIIWPRALAPYDIHLMNFDNSEETIKTANELYNTLVQSGFTVLWDDRDERVGVKFNDADLIGNPLQVMVGKKGLARGCYEYKIRKDGTKGDFPCTEVIEKVSALLETL
jgi:prolyl-tRNA synthetase